MNQLATSCARGVQFDSFEGTDNDERKGVNFVEISKIFASQDTYFF